MTKLELSNRIEELKWMISLPSSELLLEDQIVQKEMLHSSLLISETLYSHLYGIKTENVLHAIYSNKSVSI